jgi:TorA maturation chaperone TorD
MGALKLEEADAAVTEFVSLALLLLAGERDAAGSYLREHLEPWAGAFAARLADQALLSQHRLAAEVLLALFGAAEVRHEAVVS